MLVLNINIPNTFMQLYIDAMQLYIDAKECEIS